MEQLALHQPPVRPWGSPNLSPFCAKLECYLRMAEIPYRPEPMSRGQAPKGKVPYVVLDGTLIGDSHLIIEELERRLVAEGKPALDDGLSARDHAIARVVRRTLEEGFYFITMYVRWRTDDGYAAMRGEFKKFVPGFVLPLVRRDIRKKLRAQGTGRHSFDEVMAMGCADLDSVADLLGAGPFLLGDRPRTVDCTLFAFIDNAMSFPIDSPIKQRARSHANLVAYRDRIRERWWKDLAAP
jgi:glutathione S-transferase